MLGLAIVPVGLIVLKQRSRYGWGQFATSKTLTIIGIGGWMLWILFSAIGLLVSAPGSLQSAHVTYLRPLASLLQVSVDYRRMILHQAKSSADIGAYAILTTLLRRTNEDSNGAGARCVHKPTPKGGSLTVGSAAIILLAPFIALGAAQLFQFSTPRMYQTLTIISGFCLIVAMLIVGIWFLVGSLRN